MEEEEECMGRKDEKETRKQEINMRGIKEIND
jgi:hypothetical protein